MAKPYHIIFFFLGLIQCASAQDTYTVFPEIAEIPTTPTGENASSDYRFIWRMPKEIETGAIEYLPNGYHQLILNEHQHHTIPVISLVVDSADLFSDDRGIFVPGIQFNAENPVYSGNYQQRGPDWERTASLTLQYGNDVAFQTTCGLRTHGLLARSCPQKSLRLCAREELDHHGLEGLILKEAAFAKYLIIRSPYSSHANNILADALIHVAVGNSTLLTPLPYAPVACYVNGVYWGLYNVRPRPDETYYAHAEGVPVEAITMDEQYKDSVLNTMLTAIESQSPGLDALSQWLDLDCFTDYMLVESFFRNLDWAGNNNVQFYRVQNGPLKMALIDLDATFQVETENVFDHIRRQDQVIHAIWSYLLTLPEYRGQVASRYAELRTSSFHPEHLTQLLDSMAGIIENEIPRQCDRWNYPIDPYAWRSALYDTQKFILNRPHYYEEQLSAELIDQDILLSPIVSTTSLTIQHALHSKWFHLGLIVLFTLLLYLVSRSRFFKRT
ncbi:MAG: CotH kinase family protein [Flavobacteriales bacterium]|nr:CotH kinase family protein [Flavobacteriales bacterium]